MPTKHVIRAIASDWGRVVVDFDNGRTAAALVQHSSSMTDAEDIRRVLFEGHRPMLDDYMRGRMTSGDYRNQARRLLDLTCSDVCFDRAFADVFMPNEPILRLWESMRLRGVRLVAASNIEELRHAKLRELGIHDRFDRHCLSYEVGAGKPEDVFFRRLIDICGVPADEILFVDDHPEFAQVAVSCGLQALAYDLRDHAGFVKRLQERYAFERCR